MSDSSSLPPAGWYADPENPGQERWWNGASWSDHRRPAPGAVPPPPPVAPGAPAADDLPTTPVGADGVPGIPDAPDHVDDATDVTPAFAAPSSDPRPDPYGLAATSAAATTTPAYGGAPAAAPAGTPPGTPPGAPPAYGSPAAAYPGYAPRPANPNVIGLVGFIISMVAILLNLWMLALPGIAGGILSAVGLARANRLRREGVANHGRGLALAGTIVGVGTAALTILLIIVFAVISATSSSYYY